MPASPSAAASHHVRPLLGHSAMLPPKGRTVVIGTGKVSAVTMAMAFRYPRDLVIAGPTRTNLNDFRAILIDK